MRAGSLDRYIEIQTLTASQDASGQPIETPSTLANVWAHVRQMRGEEKFQSDQTVAAADTVFKIRYRSDITPLNQIVYDGRTYDITAVIELGRREALELYAKTRAE